jgi:molybdenum cofactor synthesis domain-containing protein
MQDSSNFKISHFMSLGRALVLTISDSAAAGRREDLSGPEARRILEETGFEVASVEILPDERADIESRLRRASDENFLLVVTSGGTGLSPRDVTPEATGAVIDRNVPGIAELMRVESLKVTPKASLSRAISGIRGSTLIINLPGSVKGVRECLAAVRPILPHAVQVLKQSSLGCGE